MRIEGNSLKKKCYLCDEWFSMLLHENITGEIIKAYYEVYNDLGFGFLENVYQNALFYELQDRGFKVVPQRKMNVFYKKRRVGTYYSDILVNDVVIVELKAAVALVHENELQLMNYLKASDVEVGLLLNFGKKPQFVRKIFTNENKNHHK
jgi:GxxExxY protein